MMWERKEADKESTDSAPVHNEPLRTAAAPNRSTGGRSSANIGQSLFIKGEVSGSEDLTVDGRVEGRIDLKGHNLTIGPNGRVQAELHAKHITIIGEVIGDVQADEKVDLTDSGRLRGDMRAPRISISDGAQFKGSVDMTQASEEKPVERTEKVHAKERNVTAAPAQAAQMAQAGKAIQ